MFGNNKLTGRIILQELFYFSSLLLFILIILELIFPNIVLVYFNLNYLFLIIIILGLSLLKNN